MYKRAVLMSSCCSQVTSNAGYARHTGWRGWLRECKMFAAMSDANFHILLSLCELRTLDKGHVLVEEGQEIPALMIVRSGRCFMSARSTRQGEKTRDTGHREVKVLYPCAHLHPYVVLAGHCRVVEHRGVLRGGGAALQGQSMPRLEVR